MPTIIIIIIGCMTFPAEDTSKRSDQTSGQWVEQGSLKVKVIVFNESQQKGTARRRLFMLLNGEVSCREFSAAVCIGFF